MRIKKIILIFLLIFTCGIFGGEFDYGGYVKNFNTIVYPPQMDDLLSEMTGQSNYRLNLKISYSLKEYFIIKTSYDLKFSLKDQGIQIMDSFIGNESGNSYRVDDINRRISPGDYDGYGYAIFQNLDRAFVGLYTFADFEIGRQPIAWGSARVVSPTDVITPFSYDALDTEERPGVDAIRARIPLGMMSEIDMGYIPGKDFDFDKSAAYFRGKSYIFQTDISLIGVEFQRNLLMGMSLSRAIFQAGSWLELAWTEPNAFVEEDTSNEDTYLSLSAGLDYSFSGESYGFLEYHYNGVGENEPGAYFHNLEKTAFLSGAVYLNAHHYLIAGGNYMITPLFAGGGQSFFNLNDGSILLAPYFEYNFAQDVYISTGGYLGLGKGIDNDIEGGISYSNMIKSEFGAYPDMWFLSFRIYF